jgi:hypothetical protein
MVTPETASSADDALTLMTGVTLVLGALAVTGVWRLRRLAAGTTLVAAWCWALAATCATTLAAAFASGPEHSLARYSAGILLLAPTLAVFGAKRPQNVAWPWVVLAFLAMLALPVASTWLYRPGGALQVEIAWQWLLVAVIAMGLANYSPTTRAPGAMAVAAAQICWLGDQFPTWLRFDMPAREQFGLAFICAAAWLANVKRGRESLPPLDRLWLDFRDLFGIAWTVRVAEQFNAAAARSNWPLRLNWSQVEYEQTTEPTESLPPPVQQCLENLLRRFVSREWIETRMSIAKPVGGVSDADYTDGERNIER